MSERSSAVDVATTTSADRRELELAAVPVKASCSTSSASSAPKEGKGDAMWCRVKAVRMRASLAKLLQVVFIDSKALKTLFTNFLLAYNIRSGVALLLRVLTLLAKRPKHLMSFETLLAEKFLAFRVEAVRLGLFVGGFTSIYKAIVHSLAVYTNVGKSAKWHSAVGGWFAGLALYFMDKSWHRTLALYMSTRAVQCVYNWAKLNGYWHFWGSDWKHGDSLLFILSSAQVMYAYVMRPETLPTSYYKFIVRQGPINEVILQAVRDNCRNRAINLPRIMDYIKTNGGEAAVKEVVRTGLTSEKPALIPCRALHPYTAWCWLHSLNAFKGTSLQIFPVYLSLALVPAIVLRFKTFAKGPASVLINCLLSAARSTAFLAVFCSGYQAFICAQREVILALGKRDHKLWYYVAGLFSSLSILIERKSRRSELALYAFPRAMDSLYMILYDHQLAFSVPQGEVLLFCTAMSSVMYFFQNQEDCLSPLVDKLMDRFLPKKRVGFVRRVHSNNTMSDEEGDDEDSDSKSGFDRMASQISLSGGYTIMP